MGYVNEAFDADTLARLPGNLAIGHVRYSTAGESKLANAQPIVIDSVHGQFAIGHNGNLVNAGEVRDDAGREGAIFQTNSDTEVVVHLFARSREEGSRGGDHRRHLAGARRVLVRDDDEGPRNWRARSAWVPAAGDRPARRRLGDLLGDLRPRPDRGHLRPRRRAGRGRRRERSGIKSIKPFAPAPQAQCVFEHVYFARPDSYVFGESVNEVRTELGRRLAHECPAEADVVVPIPDSGVCAAVGYADASGIPMRMGLIRNHYVGRTFIQPQQSIRHFGVKVKLNPVRSIIDGKRVVLVDDSIVRGTTSRKIVRMVRARGRARSAHAHQLPADDLALLLWRRHAAPVRVDCRDAHARGDPQVPRRRQRRLPQPRGADGGVKGGQSKYCTSCYTGVYPVAFPRDEAAYLQLALKLNSEPDRSPDGRSCSPSLEKDSVAS